MSLKFLQRKLVEAAAKKITREDFLKQLEEAWTKILSNNPSFDVGEETRKALKRIRSSPLKFAFEATKLTEEDVKTVLERIKSNAN